VRQLGDLATFRLVRLPQVERRRGHDFQGTMVR
jgi:hypothetical protein